MVDGKENFKFDLGVKGLKGHKELCRKAEKPSFVGDSWGTETALEDKEMEAHMHSTGTN